MLQERQLQKGIDMSKYNRLWKYIQSLEKNSISLSFSQIEQIAGVPIDHSFLNSKKELADYGWQVDKISMKQQSVKFSRL